MLFQTEPSLWCPMEQQNVTRKLAALLSADVQGYSRLMGDDEVATIRTLTTYRDLMTTLSQQHHGTRTTHPIIYLRLDMPNSWRDSLTRPLPHFNVYLPGTPRH